ncbi:hypothetical protein ABEW34_04590 [Paenibacillus algorifonticola]|uniref:mediterrocin family bacteriocin n=1 Tax=Paenibacillus algorifonticola TaxID=684063 RepID=UPI003D2CE77A
MKKLLLSTMVAVSALSGFASNAFAFEKAYDNVTAGKTFSQSWQLGDQQVGVWEVKYGFNTSWINEDYTHAYHNSLSVTAIVRNDTNTFQNETSAQNWAKIEVVHNGAKVF